MGEEDPPWTGLPGHIDPDPHPVTPETQDAEDKTRSSNYEGPGGKHPREVVR